MDYEKKYKEALERMKGYVKDEYGCTRLRPEAIFPELAESEDEKTRKELISFIKEGKPYHCPNSAKRQEWVAWLEKQGEKKLAEWSEEDEKKVADYLYCLNVGFTQAAAKERAKDICDLLRPQKHWKPTKGQIESLEKEGEQKPTDKVEPKFIKDKPLVIDEGKDEIDEPFTKMMLKDYTKQRSVKQCEDERMRNAAIDACKYMVDNFENSTKQYEDAIAWLKKQGKPNKEYWRGYREGKQEILDKYAELEKQGEQKHVVDDKDADKAAQEYRDYRMSCGVKGPVILNEIEEAFYEGAIRQQKPAKWSEEDEKILNSLIISLARIGASTRTDSTSVNYTFSKEIDWLKSLKQRIGE